MDETEKEKWIFAGKIGKQAREYGLSLAKTGVKILDIAEGIEKKITASGAKPAFPPNLSINQIAAHYTPKFNDETVLHEGDVLKIDVGASVDGFLSDTAATVIVGRDDTDLLKATREALEDAINIARPKESINKISSAIEKRIRSYGLSPIVNLGGHGIKRYDIHEGDFIPNVDTPSIRRLREEGAVAIEPFATTGSGYVVDGAEVQIMMFSKQRPSRSKLGREILEFVQNEYNGLPFAKRWIIKKFGPFADMELRSLAGIGALYEFNVLKEQDDGLVSQFEHTLLFDKGAATVTTI